MPQRDPDPQGDLRARLPPGAYKNVWRIIQYLRKCERDGEHLPDAPPGLRATQAKGIHITRPEKRTEQEELAIERMKGCDGGIRKCCRLFEEFADLFRSTEEHTDAAKNERAQASVREWIEDAKNSEIPGLKDFAVKLLQDVDAVVAAMAMSYSQGQTEGQVNKLKLIKRSMYGRGKFDLLRQRVKYASAA